MAQDLKILITGTLNTGATIGEINTALKGIEKRINSLKLNVEINDKVLGTLNKFTDQMKRISDAALNTGKVIEEALMPDGSKIKRTYFDGLKGEFAETIKAAKESGKTQLASLEEVAQGYDKVIKQVEKYNAAQKKVGETLTVSDANGINTRTINANAQGQVTGYKDTNNAAKEAKLNEQAAKEQQQLIEQMEQFRLQSLQRVQQRELQWSTAQQQAIQRNGDLERQEIARNQASRQAYENWWQQAITLREQRETQANQNLTNQISNYQRAAEIQANSLLNNPNKTVTPDQQNAIQNYLNSVRALNTETPQVQQRMRELALDFREVSSQVSTASQSAMTFGEKLKEALAGFALWSMTATMIYGPIRALEDMSQRLIEIDTQMTDIKRVMDAPSFTFNQMLSDAVDTSTQLSSKLTDVLSIMDNFARTGNYSEGQLVDITKTAQVLQNISDLNASDSVDTLTSAMVNFNKSAKDSIEIADKLNEVDNHYAITTKDLADSIRKTGATAKTFGVTLDELNGYTAAIGTTTRETGSVIGNGLKTIFSRITTMQPSIEILNSVGVSIRDMQGNVKPVSDILGELSGKWKNLSSEQQQNIGVTVAGRFQLTRFLALMNNWDIATKATATSMQSQGSAMKEQEKYSDSLQARLNRLDTAWNKLVLSFGQAIVTDGLVAGIESLNSLATAVATVTKYVGVLPGVFGTVGVAVVALSAKFRAFSTAIMFGTGKLTEQQLALTGLTAEMTLADIATRTFTISLRGIMVATGVGAVLAGLGFVLEKLINNYADAKKAQDDFKTEQQKGIDALTTNKDQTEELIQKYESLTEAKKKAGKNWTTNEEQDYLQVQNQLAQIFPQLVKDIDGAGNSHLKNKEQIEKEIKATNDLIEAQKNLTKANAAKDISKAMSDMDSLQNQIKAKKNNVQLGFNSVSDFLLPSLTQPIKSLTKEGKAQNEYDVKSLQNQWSDAAQKINSKILTISEAYNKLQINPTIQKSVDDFVTSLDFSKIKDSSKLEDYSKKVADLTDKMQQAYDSGDKSAFNDARNSLEKYTSKMVDTGKTASSLKVSFNDVKKATDAMKNATYSGADGVNGIGDSMDGAAVDATTLADQLKQAKGDINATKDIIMQLVQAKQYDQAITATEGQAYSDLSDKISPVNKMLEDLANGQSISASTAMDLIQKIPEMTKYLSIQNGQISVNTQGIINWRDAQINSFNDIIKAQQKALEAQKQALSQKLKMYGIDLMGIKSVAEAQQQLYDALSKKAKDEGRVAVNPDQAYPGMMDSLQGILDAEKQLDQLSSMASTGLTQVGTSIDKNNKSTEQSIYVTDKYKQSMEQLTTALDKLKNLQQQYPNYSKAYRDTLQQEIDLLKQQKDLTDNQANNLQGQISSGIIQQTGMVKTKSSGSSSSSTNYNYASGGSTDAQIWNFLKSKGLSDGAIAGIMGNLQHESGFSTTILGPQTKYGRPQGLAQWLGGRLDTLKSKPNWSSLDTQLNFLWSEWASMMPSNFNGLSATQAANVFESLFERSGGAGMSDRQSKASAIFSKFAGSGGTYSGGNSSTASVSNSTADQAQSVDQAKSDLLQLQQTSSDLQNQIQDIYLQMVQSQEAYYDHEKKQYDNQLSQFDYLQNVQDKNSADWLFTQMRREEAYSTEIDIQKQSIDYLQQQIKYNSQLTEAQKATLSDDVLQRQQELLSIEQKLLDTRSQMANEIVDTYKQALTDMKDAATKNIDNMINELNKQADQADYKKKLSDAQKSAQDIQDEINKLMLDDSTSAKKRMQDLQKQLSDQNNSISQMVSDNNKQQQLDNLNAQKDSISTYYDNLLNDQDKFNQMQKDILNINNQNIIASLNSLSSQVQQNVNVLGTSVVNTLIDAVNRANNYLNLSTANKNVIGHIASLDSGGITPKFSGGKLAVLHQDEMISNKVDTNNFLKSINLVKDMVTSLFKPANLSGVLSTATAGGNNYYVNFNVDKMTGNQNDVNTFATKFVNAIKMKGG